MTVRLIPFGATVTQIDVPGGDGQRANVLLGFAAPAEFRAKNAKVSFGATIGRYAGRIVRARFAIDGTTVHLQADDGSNALHGGGPARFDTQEWTVARRTAQSATFTLGSPGRLQDAVTYRLIAGRALRIECTARTSKATVPNLTNHAFFYLAGEGSGLIRAHRLQVHAQRYVATDAGSIPTGAFPPVRAPRSPLENRALLARESTIASLRPGELSHFITIWCFAVQD